MLSAARSLSKAKQLGHPLPRIEELRDLHDGEFKFRFHTSQTTVIAGEPGTQKSGLATFLVAKWNVPTIFFSADTDQRTAISRLAAALTGDPYRVVGEAIDSGNEAAYEDVLADCQVRFVFNPEPEFTDIEHELDAYIEAWDAYPMVIVLDNLLDIVPPGGDSEHAGYKVILLEAKKLARRTNACVLVLHHMSEMEGTDGKKKKPPSRKRLMGKVSQTPENVLSLALEDDELMISAVKQRNGPSDRHGERFIRLRADPARNRFSRWVSLDEQVNGIRRFWSEEVQ